MPETTIVDDSPLPYFKRHLSSISSRPVGRPLGKRSRPGVIFKQLTEAVLEGLGGYEGYLAWAKDNPDIFYGSIAVKLLPRPQVHESDDGQATVHVHFLITDTKDTKAIDVSPGQQSLSSPNKPIVSKAK